MDHPTTFMSLLPKVKVLNVEWSLELIPKQKALLRLLQFVGIITNVPKFLGIMSLDQANRMLNI